MQFFATAHFLLHVIFIKKILNERGKLKTMPTIIEFLEEEKVYLTNSIVEFVTNDYNPQKLIDKKNYVESLIKKASKKYKVEEDSVEVDWNKTNLSVSEEDSIED